MPFLAFGDSSELSRPKSMRVTPEVGEKHKHRMNEWSGWGRVARLDHFKGLSQTRGRGARQISHEDCSRRRQLQGKGLSVSDVWFVEELKLDG